MSAKEGDQAATVEEEPDENEVCLRDHSHKCCGRHLRGSLFDRMINHPSDHCGCMERHQTEQQLEAAARSIAKTEAETTTMQDHADTVGASAIH